MTSVSVRFTNTFYLQLDLIVDDAYQLDRQRGAPLPAAIAFYLPPTCSVHARAPLYNAMVSATHNNALRIQMTRATCASTRPLTDSACTWWSTATIGQRAFAAVRHIGHARTSQHQQPRCCIILHCSHRIILHCSNRIQTDYSEQLFVTEEDDVLVYLPSETKGGVEAQDGALVILTTPDLELVLTLETEGVLHLDVQARMRSAELTMPDGVLGQTFMWQLPTVEKELATPDADFSVEGGLAGVACSTCLFVPSMSPQQVAQYRRMLMLQTS